MSPTEWAGGKESLRRQPWALFKSHADRFFAPGMLPEGVLLYDPEHMPAEHLPLFLDHVVRMENPAADGLEDAPRRFRLSAYRDGTGDEAESIATIHRALELGVTLLDTADMYGPHTNEQLVGKATLIVAKQRHGSTGNVPLHFQS